MFEEIRIAVTSWLGRIGAWAPAVRFLVTAVISAIGSAGAVGFVTQFGAHWYVIRYGIRVPTEGIPFVASTASVFSFVLLMAAAIVYAMAFAYFRGMGGSGEGRPLPGDIVPRVFMFYCAMVAFLWLSFGLESWLTTKDFSVAVAIYSSVVVAVLLLGSVLAARFGAIRVSLLFSGTVIAASFLLWYPPYYGKFLRWIGHGGGQFVTVVVERDGREQKLRGYLMLRTGSALFLYDGHQRIREIRADDLVSAEHGTRLYWCLPGCDCEYKGTEASQPDATFR